MKKMFALLATGSLAALATPAAAQDADSPFTGFRVQATTGYDQLRAGSSVDDDLNEDNNDQSTEGVLYGAAVGYDVDLGGLVIGPEADPAGIADDETAVEALQDIANTESAFVSRGDDSGTHKMELALWKDAGLDVEGFGDWYNAVGQGMGAALNTAAGMNGYILSDRASWLNFGNKADLGLLFAGDPVLFNQYAYIPVNPEKHEHVQTELVDKLEAWLVSDRAKELINSYEIAGEQLFVFNAGENAN